MLKEYQKSMNINKIKENIVAIWNLPKELKNIKQKYTYLVHYTEALEKKINKQTTVHADIGYRGQGSQIIVIGRYHNKDYVRCFNVREENLHSLIEFLRGEHEGAKVGRFDMIGGMDFSAVYNRDEF